MTATRLAAVAAFTQKLLGEDHVWSFEIEILTLDETHFCPLPFAF
jgi:hypothetical protein